MGLRACCQTTVQRVSEKKRKKKKKKKYHDDDDEDDDKTYDLSQDYNDDSQVDPKFRPTREELRKVDEEGDS